MTPDKPSASEARENLARAIWEKKPDCGGMGKSWPLDGKTPKEIRTIKHDMPAPLELCFLYADTAIKFFQSAPAVWSSLPSGESDPLVRTDSAGADTRSPAVKTRPRDFLAWAVDMFGPVAKLRGERLMRFVEEAIELAHADEMGRATLDAIATRVYSRAPGQITKEIGQAQACLETYAENIGESASDLAEIEWQRVREIPRDEWQCRHSAKQAIGIALTDKRPPMQEDGK